MRAFSTLLVLASTASSPAAPLFTNQAATAFGGLALHSRSVSLADVDNDGDLDVLFQGTSSVSNNFNRQFLRNDTPPGGPLAFTNITGTSGPVASDTSGWSACWGDYDGDGDVDVFLGQQNPGSAVGDLFRNNFIPSGTISFTDVTATTIADPGFHQCVGWGDIDGDLDLDLMIAQEGPEPHEIYRQNANGTFTAIGAAAGFHVPYATGLYGKAYGMAMGDPDGDGDLDIYISTCRPGGNIRNNFFRNDLTGNTVALVDVADTNGTQDFENTYHAEFADFDDDGDLDLFMAGADGEDSKIWRNDGGGSFTDTDTLRGGPLLTYNGGDFNGGRAIDYDNDGDLDLYFHDRMAANGRDNARRLFRNDGGWNFTDVTHTVGLASSNEGAYDSAWGDIDRDGDMDLVFPNDTSGTEAPERLYISSASENGNHWLHVRLRGLPSNTTAIGAQLYVTLAEGTSEERTLRRDANSNAGTFNQSDLPVHFGLGTATVIDRLRIVWPSGVEHQLTGVGVDQYLTLDINTVPVGLSLLGDEP